MGDNDDDDFFNFVDLSKKRYVSDETREIMSQRTRDRWVSGEPFNKKSQQERIEEFRKVHGDRYDYSKVEYVEAHTKVIVVCPKHGDFLIAPTNHARGSGCGKCRSFGKLTEQDAIDRMRLKHGDKYDYSKVKYVSASEKVTVICPEHGEFEVQAGGHWRGRGCSKCHLETLGKSKRVSSEDWLERFRSAHGDKYDYSKSEFTDRNSNITIICSEHGEFNISPSSHASGRHCPLCSREIRNKKISETLKGRNFNPSMSNEDLVKLFKSVHGDKFDYSKVEYVNMNTKVIIICSIHGEFQQIPKSHKNGRGCARCSASNRRKNRT